MISRLSYSQVINKKVFFCNSKQSNFEVIKPETIQKSFMEFMLPFRNQKYGLRLESTVIDSIASILNSESKHVFFFDRFPCRTVHI